MQSQKKKGVSIELYYYNKNITMQQNIKCQKKKSLSPVAQMKLEFNHATHSKNKRKNIEQQNNAHSWDYQNYFNRYVGHLQDVGLKKNMLV